MTGTPTHEDALDFPDDLVSIDDLEPAGECEWCGEPTRSVSGRVSYACECWTGGM